MKTLIVFGTNERAVRVVPQILKAGYDIRLLVTRPGCASVEKVAAVHKIECFAPANINAPASVAKLKSFSPDAMVLLSYNQILKKEVFSAARLGAFNCHGGRLPEYRGSSVLNWQMINNEKRVGVSVIKVDGGIDTGDIAAEGEFTLLPDDDINVVLLRSFELVQKLVLEVLEKLSKDTLKLTKQDESRAAYWCNRTEQDGWVDWLTHSGLQIHNLTRALTLPYPCAYAWLGGHKIKLVKTSLPAERMHALPGRVSRRYDGGVLVGAAGNSSVVLHKLQLEDGTVVEAKDHFERFPAYFDLSPRVG